VVADATALARALYLTLEILEIGRPVVIALNMTDEALRDGIAIDAARLERLTGARVIPTVASKGVGTAQLKSALAEAVRSQPLPHVPEVVRPAALQADLAELEGLILAERLMDRPEEARVWAQWLLLSLDHEGSDELTGIPPTIRAAVRRIHQRGAEAGRNMDLEIIGARYQLVDRLMAEACSAPTPGRRSWTDRVDAVLTHKAGGALAFAAVMLVVFQALFSWSEPAIGAIESASRPCRRGWAASCRPVRSRASSSTA
jgi:ferrous iron transport protein B